MVVDCVSIQLLLRLCFWLRFTSAYFETSLAVLDYPMYHRAFNLMMIILVFFLRFYGLYSPSRLMTFSGEVGRVVKATVAATIVLMVITFFIRDFTFSRTFLVIVGTVLAIGISSARFMLGLAMMWIDRRRGSLRNILVVGCDENAKKLIHFYDKNPRFSTRIVGFLDDRLMKGTKIEGVEVSGKVEELSGYIKSHREIHEVVLALQRLSNETVLKIIYECEKEMVAFRWIADIFGLIASRMNVAYLGGVSLLYFTDSPLSDWENRFLKRGMDIIVSLFFLAALLPLFLLVVLLIRRDSRGPVFYGQQRIGEDGRRFTLYKFRTMSVDAEEKTGPVWAKENDPRRTRIGTLLRKTNLDELPQLWNVLIGDMSLVGPRPERPFFVSQFKEDIPRYMARHSIRSGITGWAQVNGLRGNTSIEERTKFDLYYIENWSLFFDMRILFMTLFAGRNAY